MRYDLGLNGVNAEDEVRLRPGTLSDIEAMYGLDLLCFSPVFRFTRAAMRRFAMGAGALTIVGEADGVMVGLVIVQLERARELVFAYLVTLDVHPEWRRSGVGQRLMGAAEALAESRSAGRFELHVWTENLPAIRFYEAAGFTATGVDRDFYGPRVDAVCYEKALRANCQDG